MLVVGSTEEVVPRYTSWGKVISRSSLTLKKKKVHHV